MRLFHYTREIIAQDICREGFRDAPFKVSVFDPVSPSTPRGVWLSDPPVQAFRESLRRAWRTALWIRPDLPDLVAEVDASVVLLAVDVPDGQVLRYEWTGPGKTFPERAFFVPAAILNECGVVTRVER